VRIPLSLLAVLALAACGDVGTAERLSSTETLDGIDVPTIGTVGDFPDPAKRFVVNVTADGDVSIDGTRCPDFPTLVAEVERRAVRFPGEVIEGTKPPARFSEAAIVFRVDGAAPWGAVDRLMQACFQSGVLRGAFAVRHEGDAVEGALGLALASQSDMSRGWLDLRHAYTTIAVAPGDDVTRTPALYAALLATPPTGLERKANQATRFVVIDVDPGTPTKDALPVLDAALRAGFGRVGLSFRVSRDVDSDFASAFAQWRAKASREPLRLNKQKLPMNEPPKPPAPPRVHGVVTLTILDPDA
jgi:biopolymer transport protein ExbD